MHWKKTDKPCNRVIIKGSKVFDCAPGWEVADVYYDELDLDVDSITVRFTKKEKEMGKKFVIELEDKVSENAKGEPLYFVKGFNNLSLDETALKKLTELKEEPEHEFQVGDVVRDGAMIGVIIQLYDNNETAVILCRNDSSFAAPHAPTKSLAYLNRNINSKLDALSYSIPKGEAIVVKKEEFLDWLYEKKEKVDER